MDDVIERVKADVEARAIQLHAERLWEKLPPTAKGHYRTEAASQLADEAAR